MRIVFIHRTEVSYTVETPYHHALGGTEAALSYLCVELAKLGHAVLLIANPAQPGRYLGVDCLDFRTALTRDVLDAADIVIVVNEAIGRKLRDLGMAKPLVLWTGHDIDQSAIKALESARERKAWTGFAFVSQWQLERFAAAFWVPRERAGVMRNAVAPAFGLRALPDPWFQSGNAPILAYTSAPYRGLDVLLTAFPSIRRGISASRLRIFSGLSTTRSGLDDKHYDDLYRLCLATPGVDYVGPLSQPALADALCDVAALTYPSTFPETSCIAAMEAMAIGAIVLTTNLGALPETLAGFGHMVEARENPAELATAFSAMVIDALDDMRQNPDRAAARRAEQIAFARRHYDWGTRALEWQSWLLATLAKHS